MALCVLHAQRVPVAAPVFTGEICSTLRSLRASAEYRTGLSCTLLLDARGPAEVRRRLAFAGTEPLGHGVAFVRRGCSVTAGRQLRIKPRAVGYSVDDC